MRVRFVGCVVLFVCMVAWICWMVVGMLPDGDPVARQVSAYASGAVR